ncbi:MAG: lytic transglycosylase domain-containing protein, partial [Candidatus Dormibacterales bacterium]
APIVVPRPHPPAISRAQAVADLVGAAHRFGLKPAFVLAVSWWESGWNQSAVSPDGAVGLMQITPGTAAWGGPHLLGHRVDLADPVQNADLGAALLLDYLQTFNDPKLALAAYYQGPTAAARFGIFHSSRNYVDGIWSLRNRFLAGIPTT